ncbi:single-stranded DNA-binding protein [Streptomyces sp. NPDC004610]|uniref:single-stranded DNA-binding protein n=1 Tax=unclassified Streptomyces TaxID=2593676 RepID=UPI0033A8670B
MNETLVCAVGNVATQPVYRELAAGPSARFRLAVTSRYFDREKRTWADGHTNFFTVWANRQLATNVGASLGVGDPVIVQGRLKVRSDVREGQSWTSADIDATAIGHDLARGTSAFRRAARPEPAVTTTDPARPEPDWETPPSEAATTAPTDPATQKTDDEPSERTNDEPGDKSTTDSTPDSMLDSPPESILDSTPEPVAVT